MIFLFYFITFYKTLRKWNKNNRTLLHSAILDKSNDILEHLIERGADINAHDHFSYNIHISIIIIIIFFKKLKKFISYKNTPLHLAVDMKSEYLINILIQNGANINARNILKKHYYILLSIIMF